MESLICPASKAKSFLKRSLSAAFIIEISGTQIMNHDLVADCQLWSWRQLLHPAHGLTACSVASTSDSDILFYFFSLDYDKMTDADRINERIFSWLFLLLKWSVTEGEKELSFT